jgi:hypothetical protein
VISVSADAVNPVNDGRLVHVTGAATTSEFLRDSPLGLSVNALRLTRRVEMYQWKEVEHSESSKTFAGGNQTTTTYSYEKTWEKSVIDSNTFKHPEDHTNPNHMKLSNIKYEARQATLGAFHLPPEAISAMRGDEQLEVTDQDLPNILHDIQSKFQLKNGAFYLGENPANPAIGDESISYTVLKPGEFSIVACQTGTSLASYSTRAGRDLLLVEAGDVGADLMFHDAESQNKTLTWALRGVGTFLMFIGFALLLGPIGAMTDIIPFIGGLVEMGVVLAAFLFSVAGSLLTIAFAWITFRPLLGGGLIILAALVLVVALVLGKRPSLHRAAR